MIKKLVSLIASLRVENKAVYTTAPVAGGWAGAAMSWAGAVTTWAGALTSRKNPYLNFSTFKLRENAKK